MEDLVKTVLTVSETVKHQMEAFNERLDQAKQTSLPAPETCPLVKEFEVFRSSVLFCLESLQAQMELLLKSQDDMEMRSRRKCLLLHGINENKDESTGSIANLISVLLKCPNVNESSLSKCHRLGSKPGQKPRPILIKLRNFEDKELIWKAKKQLKATGITVSEFLTKTRHNLFMAARKKFGVSKSWTQEGRIYVICSQGERHRISTMKDLEIPKGIAHIPGDKSSTHKEGKPQNKKPPTKA